MVNKLLLKKNTYKISIVDCMRIVSEVNDRGLVGCVDSLIVYEYLRDLNLEKLEKDFVDSAKDRGFFIFIYFDSKGFLLEKTEFMYKKKTGDYNE